MKKLLYLPLLCGLAFGANFQLEAEYRTNPLTRQSQGYFTITALDNNLVVSDVIVNKGNCKNSFKAVAGTRAAMSGQSTNKPTIPLNYGNHVELATEGGCRILEIQIKSNKGDETYKF